MELGLPQNLLTSFVFFFSYIIIIFTALRRFHLDQKFSFVHAYFSTKIISVHDFFKAGNVYIIF